MIHHPCRNDDGELVVVHLLPLGRLEEVATKPNDAAIIAELRRRRLTR